MSLQKNPLFNSSIKEEYLPPPLQQNYLSLFDIQVKMTKQFLPGTEQDKINTIKNRIKKFFDYGNQTLSKPQTLKKNSASSPCQIDKSQLKDGLKIDCSKIILFGSQMTTYQTAQKMFPGFIGFERIDDCNIKLSFSKKEQCQNLLIQNSKNPTTILIQHIRNPTDIQWFELQLQIGEEKKQFRKYYARFTTNKDKQLLGNESYFRKLLGKARQLVDQKESQTLQSQKQAEVKHKINKPRPKKRKFIRKNFMQKKFNNHYYDSQTNYDGLSFGERSQCFQLSRQFHEHKNRNFGLSYEQKYSPRERVNFQSLDLSQIRPVPIDLQEYSKEKGRTNQMIGKSCDKRRENIVEESKVKKDGFNLREYLIKQYREKQFTNCQPIVKPKPGYKYKRHNGYS